MSLEHILFQFPWISYNDNFLKSRIILTYPKNVIFTAQFLKHVMESDVYKKYPHAEKMDVTTFQDVDWINTVVIFNNNLDLILAPDPVHRLVRLSRRLQYKDAVTAIFGPFRLFPVLELFRFQVLGILLIIFYYGITKFYAIRYKVHSLVLSSKTLTDSKDPPNR